MSGDTYPDAPGSKDRSGSTTSRVAAAAFAPKAKPIRLRTLEVIETRPSTPEEVADQIDVHFMIVRARVSELRAQGLVTPTGEKGRGALGGRVLRWRSTSPEERALFAARKAALASAERRDG